MSSTLFQPSLQKYLSATTCLSLFIFFRFLLLEELVETPFCLHLQQEKKILTKISVAYSPLYISSTTFKPLFIHKHALLTVGLHWSWSGMEYYCLPNYLWTCSRQTLYGLIRSSSYHHQWCSNNAHIGCYPLSTIDAWHVAISLPDG